MIKDCRITDLPIYGYDIKHNDVTIAKAHLLNIRDKSKLMQSVSQQGDNSIIDMSVAIDIVIAAVESWEFADDKNQMLKINRENVETLLPEYVFSLVNGIVKAETNAMQQVSGIEKN